MGKLGKSFSRYVFTSLNQLVDLILQETTVRVLIGDFSYKITKIKYMALKNFLCLRVLVFSWRN